MVCCAVVSVFVEVRNTCKEAVCGIGSVTAPPIFFAMIDPEIDPH